MLQRLGIRMSRIAERVVPDPFVLAILLTLVTFVLALGYTGFEFVDVLWSWVDGKDGGKSSGFWVLLAFGMQMCLILVTGHALATSPPARKLLTAIADRATTPIRAVVLVSVVAMALALVNWGLGLIAGALLAREVGQRAREAGTPIHYPLVCAAGYAGLLVWHGGLSGSAPIKVTLEKDVIKFLGAELGGRVGTIPLGETLGSAGNLAVNVALLLLVPLALALRLPPAGERAAAPPAPQAEKTEARPGGKLETSPLVTGFIAVPGLALTVMLVGRQGIDRLDPNLINFALLWLGLLLHGSARAYGRAVAEATRGCAGIILQFPLYAGIMGLLAGSGLIDAFAGGLAGLGSSVLPAAAVVSAGVVNLFVPSGGGQWAIQGPVLMRAAVDAGVEPSRLVMALAYGDQWTNMLQPFWALPLLAITGVGARDIMGYTAVLFVLGGAVFLAGVYL